jgi:hypothetical protein
VERPQLSSSEWTRELCPRKSWRQHAAKLALLNILRASMAEV